MTIYPMYTEIYMYNFMLYPVKNVWSEREIIPYFAPSTTRNASTEGSETGSMIRDVF